MIPLFNRYVEVGDQDAYKDVVSVRRTSAGPAHTLLLTSSCLRARVAKRSSDH